jgi:hypothetical protein
VISSSRTFADSKTRIGSGGFNRGQSGNQTSKIPNSGSGRVGNLNSNPTHKFGNINSEKFGNHGSSHTPNNGTKISGGFPRPNVGTKLPQHGNSNHSSNSGHGTASVHGKPIVKVPGLQGHGTRPDLKVTLPSNLHNKIGHTIKLPNGNTTKPIAANVTQLLKHKGHPVHVQPQIQQIVQKAPKHLCHQPHFNWWVSTCHHHCHQNYGCWNVTEQYWDCWTPCSWQVVQHEQFSYYVGLSCVHIPDMQAYGVQSVVNGSPAHLGGLLPGDLILTVNAQPVMDPNLVNAELVRGRLDLQVIREGVPTPITLSVFPRLVQSVSF